MSAKKKLIVRPNFGNPLRPRAKTKREHFLVTDVSKDEQKEILRHCLEKKISVSQFLADVVLQDAADPKPARQQKVTIRVELELTGEEQEKLELLVRLNKKDNLGQLIRELLQPSLDMQRTHAPLETTSLRYYLSKEEHETATRHMAAKGISARNYAAMLALKAIARDSAKRK
jgi:hypothetical protein